MMAQELAEQHGGYVSGKLGDEVDIPEELCA